MTMQSEKDMYLRYPLHLNYSSSVIEQILRISIYNDSGGEEKKFGDHGRAAFFVGAPDFESILKAEENGDFIRPIEGNDRVEYGDLAQQVRKFQSDKGKVLVLSKLTHTALVRVLTSIQASGISQLRDKVRHLIGSYLQKGVKLKELDYQP